MSKFAGKCCSNGIFRTSDVCCCSSARHVSWDNCPSGSCTTCQSAGNCLQQNFVLSSRESRQPLETKGCLFVNPLRGQNFKIHDVQKSVNDDEQGQGGKFGSTWLGLAAGLGQNNILNWLKTGCTGPVCAMIRSGPLKWAWGVFYEWMWAVIFF